MKFDLGHINELNCITVDIKGEKPVYHYIQLKYKNKEISFGKSELNILEFDVLSKKITPRNPVVIHFTGKGILNRKVKKEENYRHTILLNAQMDDFYFSEYVEKDFVYSSVIRRDTVEEIHAQFTKRKHIVIAISSGPFIAAPLAQYFNSTTFFVDDIEIVWAENKIQSFEKKETKTGAVKIGQDKIDAKILGTVSLAAYCFNPSPDLRLSNDHPIYRVNLMEAKQKNIFYRFGMGLMFFFLLLLSANYFYLGHLNKKIENNYIELSGFEEQLALIGSLEEEYGRKENLLRSSGLLGNKFLSFYLSEIGLSVPSQISFESIEVRPLIKDIKKKQKIEFNDRLIYIKGFSATSEMLSEWIEDLKTKDWIQKVEIIEYNLIKNQGAFKLEIAMN